MSKDRRSNPRIRVQLPARWEGVLHKEKGTITDLSRSGCFVLTGGQVEIKELIWLEIQIPETEPVCFWAEVVDQAYEIGFAVRFNSGDEADEKRLQDYVETVIRTSPEKLS
jgi:PilZ domain-containing protein